MMKIAVTGASGFIGKHVINALENENVEIIAISRSINNLISSSYNIKKIEMNISKPNSLDYDHMDHPDVLIHLAWGGLPNYSSLHHFEEELPHQYYFLKNLINSGLRKIIISGTCLEYGMQFGELQEYDETSPITPYGLAKDMLRRELEFLQEKIPFSLIWTRIFYTYGNEQSKNSIFSQLKETVNKGEKTFNMSGGEQIRDYLPIREIAKKIVFLALCEEANGIYNICSGKPISIRKLVEEWIMKNNWEILLNLGYYPYVDYEPMAFWGSPNRLNKLLHDYRKIEITQYQSPKNY